MCHTQQLCHAYAMPTYSLHCVCAAATRHPHATSPPQQHHNIQQPSPISVNTQRIHTHASTHNAVCPMCSSSCAMCMQCLLTGCIARVHPAAHCHMHIHVHIATKSDNMSIYATCEHHAAMVHTIIVNATLHIPRQHAYCRSCNSHS